MRSENFIEERVNGLCLLTELSISLRTESSLQVSSSTCLLILMENIDSIVFLRRIRSAISPSRYFIYGMQDAQNLERVKLEFSIFDIPRGEQKPKSE